MNSLMSQNDINDKINTDQLLKNQDVTEDMQKPSEIGLISNLKNVQIPEEKAKNEKESCDRVIEPAKLLVMDKDGEVNDKNHEKSVILGKVKSTEVKDLNKEKDEKSLKDNKSEISNQEKVEVLSQERIQEQQITPIIQIKNTQETQKIELINNKKLDSESLDSNKGKQSCLSEATQEQINKPELNLKNLNGGESKGGFKQTESRYETSSLIAMSVNGGMTTERMKEISNHRRQALSISLNKNFPSGEEIKVGEETYWIGKAIKNNVYYIINDQNVKSNNYVLKEVKLEMTNHYQKLLNLASSLENPNLVKIHSIQTRNENLKESPNRIYMVMKRYKFNLRSFLTYLDPKSPSELKLLLSVFHNALSKVKDIVALGYVYPNIHAENIFVEEGKAIFTDFFYEDILSDDTMRKKTDTKFQHPELRAIIKDQTLLGKFSKTRIVQFWEFSLIIVFIDFFCKKVGLNIFEYNRMGIEQALEVLSKEVHEEFCKTIEQLILIKYDDLIIKAKEVSVDIHDLVNMKSHINKNNSDPLMTPQKTFKANKADISTPVSISTFADLCKSADPKNAQVKSNLVMPIQSPIELFHLEERDNKSVERVLEMKLSKRTPSASIINKQNALKKAREATPNRHVKDISTENYLGLSTNLQDSYLSMSQSPPTSKKQSKKEWPSYLKENYSSEIFQNDLVCNTDKMLAASTIINTNVNSKSNVMGSEFYKSQSFNFNNNEDNGGLKKSQYPIELVRSTIIKNNPRYNGECMDDLRESQVMQNRKKDVNNQVKQQDVVNISYTRTDNTKSFELRLNKSKSRSNQKVKEAVKRSREITPKRLCANYSDVTKSLTATSMATVCTPQSKQGKRYDKVNTSQNSLSYSIKKMNRENQHTYSTTTDFTQNIQQQNYVNSQFNQDFNFENERKELNSALKMNFMSVNMSQLDNQTPNNTSSYISKQNSMVLTPVHVNSHLNSYFEDKRSITEGNLQGLDDIKESETVRIYHEKENTNNALSSRSKKMPNQKEHREFYIQRPPREFPKLNIIHLDIEAGSEIKPTPYRVIKAGLYKLFKEEKLKVTSNELIVKDPSTKDNYYILSAKNASLIYYGQINTRGQKHGTGRYYDRNEVYCGQFVADLKHGIGIYYYENNEHYEGEWSQDYKHGEGCLYYPNNKIKMTGTWQNDYLNGNGIFYFEDGQTYEGEFKNSKFHGTGILFYENKIPALEGTWRNGLKHGDFKIFDKEGNLLMNSCFENDEESYKHVPVIKGKFLVLQLQKVEMDEDYPNSPGSTPKLKKKTNMKSISTLNEVDNKYLHIISDSMPKLNREDFKALDNNLNNTITSNIISFYLNEMRIHHKKAYINEDNSKPLDYFLSPEFHRMLFIDDDYMLRLTNGTYNVREWNYENIHYLFKKYSGKGFTIFDLYDKIFFLTKDQQKNHWGLFEINCQHEQKFEVILYDANKESICNNNEISQVMSKYIDNEIKRRCSEYDEDYALYMTKLANVELVVACNEDSEIEKFESDDKVNSGIYTLSLIKELVLNGHINSFNMKDHFESIKEHIREKITNVYCYP